MLKVEFRNFFFKNRSKARVQIIVRNKMQLLKNSHAKVASGHLPFGFGTYIRTWDTNPDIFGQRDIFGHRDIFGQPDIINSGHNKQRT